MQCVYFQLWYLILIHISKTFSTGGDKWQYQLCPLTTFCCVEVEPQKRLFQNMKTYEAKAWQDTAWQESFQLTMAWDSSGKSPPVLLIHRRKMSKCFLERPLIFRDYCSYKTHIWSIALLLLICYVLRYFAGRPGLGAEDLIVLWENCDWLPLLCLQLQNSL